jgi:pimeloyl-ACP methyl ester carboxylesterase
MVAHSPSEPRLLCRQVFYIGGFFTGGPAFYGRVLKREAQRFARAHGVPIWVTDAGNSPDSDFVARYHLRAETPQGFVETAYELLRWEDIVLDQFARPWSWRVREAAATLFDYLVAGVFRAMLQRMRRFALIWLFPFIYYPGALLLSAAAGLVVSEALGGGAAGFLTGFGLGALGLLGAGSFGRRCFAYLFLNDWILNRAIALDRAPEIWTRIDAFADQVAQRMEVPGRETVLVGHSFGASLAPLVAARLAERHPGVLEASSLTLVTLGGSLAVIGFHPRAACFRARIEAAARLDGVFWIDVSSSLDAINFKRFDPVASFGLQGRAPVLRDTRFGGPTRRGLLAKLNLMSLHMQFIKASEQEDGYDYIKLLTGWDSVRDALGGYGAHNLDRGNIITRSRAFPL